MTPPFTVPPLTQMAWPVAAVRVPLLFTVQAEEKPTVKDWITRLAARKLAFPAWEAVIEQVLGSYSVMSIRSPSRPRVWSKANDTGSPDDGSG